MPLLPALADIFIIDTGSLGDLLKQLCGCAVFVVVISLIMAKVSKWFE